MRRQQSGEWRWLQQSLSERRRAVGLCNRKHECLLSQSDTICSQFLFKLSARSGHELSFFPLVLLYCFFIRTFLQSTPADCPIYPCRSVGASSRPHNHSGIRFFHSQSIVSPSISDSCSAIALRTGLRTNSTRSSDDRCGPGSAEYRCNGSSRRAGVGSAKAPITIRKLFAATRQQVSPFVIHRNLRASPLSSRSSASE